MQNQPKDSFWILEELISELIEEEFFDKELMNRMGYEYVGRHKRTGSDSFVQKDDPSKDRNKKVIKAVNKNLSKKNNLHDPPAMGLSIGKKI